jgi:hypothetical protein
VLETCLKTDPARDMPLPFSEAACLNSESWNGGLFT